MLAADIKRTRQAYAMFKRPEVMQLVSQVLERYCVGHSIRYKQGQNELIAPFVMLQVRRHFRLVRCFPCLFFFSHTFVPGSDEKSSFVRAKKSRLPCARTLCVLVQPTGRVGGSCGERCLLVLLLHFKLVTLSSKNGSQHMLAVLCSLFLGALLT